MAALAVELMCPAQRGDSQARLQAPRDRPALLVGRKGTPIGNYPGFSRAAASPLHTRALSSGEHGR